MTNQYRASLGASARLLLLSTALCALLLSACDRPTPTANSNQASQPAAPSTPGAANRIAVIETTAGTIKVELLGNEAPKTAENFRQLAESGFYDGLIFHRTINGFMIQGGDPRGDGTGGRTASGQPLPNEVNAGSPLYQGGYRRGAVAMANQGGNPATGTSQFFIMHQDRRMPPQYTIFGRVTEGLEVVDKIAAQQTGGPTNDRPLSPVAMKRVYIQ